MKPTHSPTPWCAVTKDPFDLGLPIADRNGFPVAYVNPFSDSFGDKQSQANLGFILLAVNNHDALMEALRDMLRMLEITDSLLLQGNSAKNATSLLAKLEAGK